MDGYRLFHKDNQGRGGFALYVESIESDTAILEVLSSASGSRSEGSSSRGI